MRHRSPERRAEIVRDQLLPALSWAAARRQAQYHADQRVARKCSGLIARSGKRNTRRGVLFGDADPELFAVRKPLLWFWKMFDRSPIGLNLWLGIRFRCMLGRHIFDHMGSGVKIYHGVDLTYGYNLSIGDGAVIHHGALLHDRGGITIGKGAVIGSFARIFSHSYTSDGIDEVKLMPIHDWRYVRASEATPFCWVGRTSARVKWLASYPVFRASASGLGSPC